MTGWASGARAAGHRHELVAREIPVQRDPGMPVEAFIETAPRIVASFLVKPLTDHVEAPLALPRADEGSRLRDGQLGRSPRSGRQDRARDDDADRGLLLDDEIRADRQHRRLRQQHA